MATSGASKGHFQRCMPLHRKYWKTGISRHSELVFTALHVKVLLHFRQLDDDGKGYDHDNLEPIELQSDVIVFYNSNSSTRKLLVQTLLHN